MKKPKIKYRVDEHGNYVLSPCDLKSLLKYALFNHDKSKCHKELKLISESINDSDIIIPPKDE